jgi:C4-dicarboxylate transporter, DctM subunit
MSWPWWASGGSPCSLRCRAGLNLLAKDMYDVFSSYSLTTIPLFILMGQIAFNSGISSKLYASAYRFLGHTKGGLSIATVSACTAFGAVCGSSAATAATMATVGLPEMRKFGYSDALAAGSVSAGGGLGMIMPPSVVLMVSTASSPSNPSADCLWPASSRRWSSHILFIITISIWCSAASRGGAAWREIHLGGEASSHSRAWGRPWLVFVACIGGLFFGLFTATEAAGVGVMGVLLVAFIRRQIDLGALLSRPLV